MKRTTVGVFSPAEYGMALNIRKYLAHHGVDVVVVTKHAVQVHPDHTARAAEVLPQYRWGWDRPQNRTRQAGAHDASAAHRDRHA